ncbi:MAG: Lrp/AsnC family transcriptional regulator [Candidatus Andeanibacterium colombiense]|uniref:Lrp/AsnC family transcriptional regulator n=1 Tax=Candidatus Andeanibacterium colombiense TaxID=3121345 RepID=A0AAJ5X5H2_9SPHN|nr:MAG: Lrp/AsnC family transcriptional regulator [Sphingomonadaceae bacterium]
MTDRIDKAILRNLEQDGRMSFNALSEKINLSKTPSWTRVQALEREGVITGYRAMLSPERLGLELQAFVQARVASERCRDFEAAVMRNGSVLACYAMTGEADYLLQVLVENVAALDDLVRNRISIMPGVKGVLTLVVLKKIKDHGLISDCL